MRRAIFIIITLLCIGVKVHAQIDPTLAGMDSHLYRKVQEDLEEPRENHAPANHRTHLDERGG